MSQAALFNTERHNARLSGIAWQLMTGLIGMLVQRHRQTPRYGRVLASVHVT